MSTMITRWCPHGLVVRWQTYAGCPVHRAKEFNSFSEMTLEKHMLPEERTGFSFFLWQNRLFCTGSHIKGKEINCNK